MTSPDPDTGNVRMLRSFLHSPGPARLLGLLLVLLFGALAFLLGCFEMLDTDVWWHLRGGEWILQHGMVPDLDPFSFGSADQRWIDLHWLSQAGACGLGTRLRRPIRGGASGAAGRDVLGRARL
jgi:hypothetical protein